MSNWFKWLLGGLLVGGAVFAATVVIVGIITINKLKEKLRNESKNAGQSLYAIIEEVQPNKVSLSTFNRNGERVKAHQYESSDGVSDEIYEGLRINV